MRTRDNHPIRTLRALARLFAGVPLGLSLLGSGSCIYEEVGTQVTLRVYASSEVRRELATLKVRIASPASHPDDDALHTIAARDITAWPVDVQVVPALTNGSDGSFDVVLDALDAASVPIVQQRATTAFVRYEKRVVELWLERCGTRPLGTLCETNPACRGPACLTCIGGQCAPTPFVDARESLDPAALLDPEKRSPTSPSFDLDAGSGELGLIDAGLTSPADADGSGFALPSDGGLVCNQSWVGVFGHGRIPPGTPHFAELILEGSPRRQYICRARAPNEERAVGKVNGTEDGGLFDYGCYYGFFDRDMNRWQGLGADQQGAAFDVFSPPAACKLGWSQSGRGQVPPASALVMTSDSQQWPVYACRIHVSDLITVGDHIGRVTGGERFDRCIVQYFGSTPIERDKFEVLVQQAQVPMAR